MQKGFRVAQNAKTPSYFCQKDFIGIGGDLKNILMHLGARWNESIRYCLHKSPQDFLHIMLIYHPYPKLIKEQIFENTDSYYLLLKGVFELENLISKEVILLRADDVFIVKIAQKVPYQMRIISQDLLFLEVRGINEELQCCKPKKIYRSD
ncbi:MAG: hypothetical protein K2I71_04260 [Helicobacter sp.]|nr:hypothetical protein [Helicobacter sp.]